MSIPFHEAIAATFWPVANSGAGDCIAMGQALADRTEENLTAKKFVRGGSVQRTLRHMAAQEIQASPGRYPRAGPDPRDFVTRMSAVGVKATCTIMRALAQRT